MGMELKKFSELLGRLIGLRSPHLEPLLLAASEISIPTVTITMMTDKMADLNMAEAT